MVLILQMKISISYNVINDFEYIQLLKKFDWQ